MKYRLDQLLAQRQLYPSREKAKAHILAGDVLINDKVVTKAGYLIDDEADIRVKKQDRYVSRGGVKLEKALKDFQVDVTGLVILDVGASTGGFTDCLLQNGVQKVYCVDVGYNQLHYRLRSHPDVITLEKLNAKNLSSHYFNHPLNLAVIDVSFISLPSILSSILSVLAEKRIIALVKPQFEIGKDIPHFKGIVREAKYHLQAIEKVSNFATSIGMYPAMSTYSPITGPKGNMEFFIYLTDKPTPLPDYELVVEEAHQKLD